MHGNKIYMFIVAVFIVLLFCIGFMSSKKVKRPKDWMVAGQSLGIIPSMGTYFATLISSTSVISYIGYYYLNGWGAWWNVTGTVLTSFLAVVFFGTQLKKTGKLTLLEYIEERYSQMEALMSTVLVLISSVFLLCAQITGAALVLQVVSGLNNVVCVVIISVIFVTLTVIGGMYSVAWTDTLCALIMLIGTEIMAVALLNKNGGFVQTQETLYALNPEYLNPVSLGYPMIISWMFTWGVGNFGAPHFVGRFLIAKDESTIRISQGVCSVLFLLFHIALILIGTSGIVAYPGIEQQDQVTITLIRGSMPPIVGGIVMAAIISACISTADSILLLAATTASNDIYKRYLKKSPDERELLRFSRIVTVCLGTLAVVFTLFQGEAILWIQAKAITLMGSALAPSVMFGLAWKKANKYGGIASFICGLATAIVWYVLDQPFSMMPMLPAFIVGSVVMVAVSLAFQKKS